MGTTIKSRIDVLIEPETLERLNILADTAGVSRSELIRIMINDYLFRLDKGEI